MKKSTELDNKVTWQNITKGGNISEPGNSRNVKTGDWRSNTPIFIEDKCKQCALCIPVCPEDSIPYDEKGVRGDFDYYSCKGCGICAKVCPFKAIDMKEGGNI